MLLAPYAAWNDWLFYTGARPWSSEMCNQLRLETQNQAWTWLNLGSSRTHTCAYLDTLHWPCVLPRVGWCRFGPLVSLVESKRRLFGTAAKKWSKIAHHANCNAEAPENWVQWAHCNFSLSSLQIIRTCLRKRTMKVEFSYGIYTLFSRYLRLKVHIANPDSNLAVLNLAYEYWQPRWAFN